jgi:hypothetical protein
MRKLFIIAVISAVGIASYSAGKQTKYNEIRERANKSNQFGEGYFTSLDVEEIIEGYED